jgi:hypothetical protein
MYQALFHRPGLVIKNFSTAPFRRLESESSRIFIRIERESCRAQAMASDCGRAVFSSPRKQFGVGHGKINTPEGGIRPARGTAQPRVAQKKQNHRCSARRTTRRTSINPAGFAASASRCRDKAEARKQSETSPFCLRCRRPQSSEKNPFQLGKGFLKKGAGGGGTAPHPFTLWRL